MESNFNFSGIIPIVIAIVVVAVKFLSSKPQVDTMADPDSNASGEEPEEGPTWQQVLRGEQINDSRAAKLATPSSDRVAARGSAKQSARRSVGANDETSDESLPIESPTLGRSIASEVAEDFDIQKAVIMSEILERKYED